MSPQRPIIPIIATSQASTGSPAAAVAPASAPAIEPLSRIHPRSVTGFFSRLRWFFIALTQGIYFGLPWVNWQGRQAVLFDLDARRFDFFGTVFFPQDLILLTGVLVFAALLLFVSTALVGRVWCGFACPQTVYTALFLSIERRIEGNRLARLRLDAAPWRGTKLLRRGGKHLAWGLVALLTGFSLVGWFTPIRHLTLAIPTLDFGPWEAFWILFYGAATYVHAGLLKEKVCQHACPYGRFQGAMLDVSTRVIAYDAPRGEPRGPRSRGVSAHSLGQGDCVDCTLCVQVCPVGIDIRQGLQAACISCGLCIDACNTVMDRLKTPRGLISFRRLADSTSTSDWQRPRVLVYAAGLLVVGAAVIWGALNRPEVRLSVLRDRTVLSRQIEGGAAENVYRLQILNASMNARHMTVSAYLEGLEEPTPTPLEVVKTHALEVDAAGLAMEVVTLRMAPELVERLQNQTQQRAVPIRLEIRDAQEAQGTAQAVKASTPSTFMLP